MMTVTVALVCLLVGALVGRKYLAPAPPAPKSFGIQSAETVARKLGSLTPIQAQAAQVAALVGGMSYTLPDEVKALRATLSSRVADNEAEISALKAEIAANESNIAAAMRRDGEVVRLANSFGA